MVDFESLASLTDALKSQDAVIDAISNPDPSTSMRLMDAAVAAGVCRYIPPEFSGDPANAKTRSLPVLLGKTQAFEYIQKLAAENKITWTAISNNAFLDWALRMSFVNIDLLNKKIVLMNDGDHIFTWTVLSAVGTAVSNALMHAEKTKNRTCYIYSIQKSQKEVATLAKEAVGTEGWNTESVDMENVFREAMSAVNSGNYSWQVMGDLIRYSISTPGFSGPVEKDDNDLLGVRPMSNDEVKSMIKEIYEELKFEAK